MVGEASSVSLLKTSKNGFSGLDSSAVVSAVVFFLNMEEMG